MHLENIVFKDHLTNEECLTLQIELPGLEVFIKELRELADQIHLGLGIFPSFLYNTKLISIQTALNNHITKQFPASACECRESNCWTQKEYERLQQLTEEIERYEFEFLSLACSTPSVRPGKDIQALIQKCEKFIEGSSSVTAGELCNNTIKSIRKFLLTRAETLESKLVLLLNEKLPDKKDFPDREIAQDENAVKLCRSGGGNQCCIAECQNGAGMQRVTCLQGKYEIDLVKANEPSHLFVCNTHVEMDRQHHSSTVFPETQAFYTIAHFFL